MLFISTMAIQMDVVWGLAISSIGGALDKVLYLFAKHIATTSEQLALVMSRAEHFASLLSCGPRARLALAYTITDTWEP
jgi:hypothetical protein